MTMKVLFYNDPPSAPGGAETYWHQTAQFLAQAGVEVLPFSLERPVANAAGRLKAALERPHCFPSASGIQCFQQAVQDFQPDVIHLNKNLRYAPSIKAALRAFNLPVVATVHDHFTVPFPIDVKNRLKRWIYPFRHCAKYHIIPSRSYYDLLKKRGGRDIVYIPNFIDSQYWRFKDCYDSAGKNLLYVGRLEPLKGIWVLIDALRLLLKRDPAIQLTIIGQGSQEQKIRQIIARKKLSGHIKLLGYQPPAEVLRQYHGSTLLVVPSLHNELFGLVGLEAQASGLPVIASDLPGIREWCIPGVTGMTVPPGDARQLADGIEKMLHDPSLRQALRKQARAYAEANYPVDQAIGKLIGFYTQIFEDDSRKLTR